VSGSIDGAGGGEGGRSGQCAAGGNEAGGDDGGGGCSSNGDEAGGSSEGGAGYAFVEPRRDGRRHDVALAEGATTTIPFSWHDAPGLAAPADLWLEVQGRTVLQIASVGGHPFARAGLEVSSMEPEAGYRLELRRERDTLSVSVTSASGEVVLRTPAHIDDSAPSASVVLPDVPWRTAISSDVL
jgi:hypothetical protein